MNRPAGDPGALTAGARRMDAAAGALRDVRGRLQGATSFPVVAGAWRGPASEAFLVDGAGLQGRLDRAADAVHQAAAALAELASRLDQAQTTWDRAQRLAATAGIALDPHGGIVSPGPGPERPGGGAPPGHGTWPGPSGGVGPAAGMVGSAAGMVGPAAVVVAGQAVRLAAAAGHEAAAARRTAAARLDQAATVLRSPSPGRGAAGTHPDGGLAGHLPAATRSRTAADGHGAAAGGRDVADDHGHEGPLRRAVGGALEVGAEVAIATHHLVAGAEARVEAAGRLAATAGDPAVRAAAGRVAETTGRPLLDGRVVGALPLIAPVLDLGAALSHGEPLPRAIVGAVGSAVGADLGGRVGLAACGGQAAATQGVGVVVCPALTAVGGAVGAQAGKAAALHLYDKLAGPPEPPPTPRSSP